MNCKLSQIFFVAGSIRTKVWICVLIALVGYFIATLSSFYSNSRQAERLATLQTIHFPLARLSDETVNTFKNQIAKYENAFLTGETDQAIEGNHLSTTILQLLEQMKKVSDQNTIFSPEAALIDELHKQYNEFYQLAAEVYLRTQAIETSLELQQKVQQLGNMQTRLLNDLLDLSQLLAQSVEQHIQDERRHAQTNTLFLGLLFVLVLISATLISRCFANRQLIEPLTHIQEMVVRFTQNREILRPPHGNQDDEINNLAASFWSMTEELKQTMVSKSYVDNIIKHMSGCLMVLAADRSLIKINNFTATLLGFSEEEMLGCQIDEFISNDTIKVFQSFGLNVLARGEEVNNLEICLMTRQGTIIPALFSGSVMRSPDREIEAIICVVNDITQRKKTEEMLQKLAVERALAKTASLAAIGELTSSIAHEMRNPLSSIKMNIQTIQQNLGNKDALFSELAEITCQQSLRLETMLNDLLSYGKPLQLNLSRSSFPELMQKTLVAIAQEKKNKGVVLEINNSLGDDLPLVVDVELFIRAFSNLILNAIQWSPKEGTVQISARIAQSRDDQENQVIILVRDNGPGINPEKIGRLFQPFFTTREGGTGLGLANVRKIIEYHGGMVTGNNSPDGGAVFTIFLPLLPQQHAPNA
ncbi:MAG: PAS domain S-box protein [Proteobacteria bacterium]|nr:PAS domain S-box protein [Pseudomonadota bacterium]MBU1546511.1 PAS domain S-box protein [Pseudomonadota bacterium]MBU2620221.1 PAS domain S-box protein [Pseudomonadota bacterium]